METENEIRDYLVEHLDVIESGLHLYEKELYAPNNLGTRSFIDIVAKSDDGTLVLIELKRSAAASREALHEVFKYVEAVKHHLAMREDEIRVIIASTDWTELLVPFSRLISETTIALQGIWLKIVEESITGSTVRPLEMSYGRVLAPWHDVNFCESRQQVAHVLNQYSKRSQQTGMGDYVVLILHSAEGRTSQHEATLRHMITGIDIDQCIADDPAEKQEMDILRYHYIVYFGAQMLPETAYWKILEACSKEIEDHRLDTGEMKGDELLLYLHDNAWASGGNVASAYLEIGNAAKLKARLLGDEAWKVWGLLRFGSFERNLTLSDETLIRELCGSEGYTHQGFDRNFSTSNRAQVASVREGILRCLEENDRWRTELLHILNELGQDYPDSQVELSISNPAAGLLTPYFFATKPQGALYLPTYTIGVLINQVPVRVYAGFLSPENDPVSLATVLKEFYGDDIRKLIYSFSWGGRTPDDEKLTAAYGCRHASLRRDLIQNPLQLYSLNSKEWVPCDPVLPHLMYEQHLSSHPEFFKALFEMIGKHDHGSWFEL